MANFWVEYIDNFTPAPKISTQRVSWLSLQIPRDGSECRMLIHTLLSTIYVYLQFAILCFFSFFPVPPRKKRGWFGMQGACDEECPWGISRLAGHTSPRIPAEEGNSQSCEMWTTAQGTQGKHGSQVIQGTQGTPGTQGPQVTQGAQGTRVTQGKEGTPGTQGTQGTQVSLGTHGTHGSQGT